MVKKKNLEEISFIRPILIVFLVLYHAFSPWNSAWSAFDGYIPSKVYHWIADLSYSFMLPMFIFSSGYVWSFQHEYKGHSESLKELVLKKAKRLIIPSILFSLVYLSIFSDIVSIKTGVITLLQGAGHMWFLPMLFWCFIISFFLRQIENSLIRYIVILLLTALCIVPLPFQVANAFSYLIYFNIGYDLYARFNDVKRFFSRNHTLCLWLLFATIFICSRQVNSSINTRLVLESNFILKLIFLEMKIMIVIMYSLAGILAIYSTSIMFTTRNKLPSSIIRIGDLCFGVYLFQQFILMLFYYHTPLPQLLGLSLPWISFFFTLYISLGLSYLMRLSKIGRKLI